jgi:hypothetical protein
MHRRNSLLVILIGSLVALADSLAWGQPAERPKLVKLPFAIAGGMENTPIVYRGRPLLLLNYRDDTKVNTEQYVQSMYLYAVDLQTGRTVGKFGEGHSFVNGFVEGDRLHVFATAGSNFDWFQSIYHFWTDDLITWQRELAIERNDDERLFNCSVCRDDDGYLMAYESNRPVQFCFRFARSKDLRSWKDVPQIVFKGPNDEYSACPVIRYFAPYYYAIYLHAPIENHNGWVSFIARSKDLATWQLSPFNPVLEAEAGEGSNNSDVDLFEWEGNTYVVFATGDQATWGSVRMAMHPAPVKEFLTAWFPENSEMTTVSAKVSTNQQ